MTTTSRELPAADPGLTTQAERVLVLDFGSQYAQLIARRVREQHVYCEIVKHDITAARVRELDPIGIVLSGGPSSVYESGSPRCDPALFELGIPVLGICYACILRARCWEEKLTTLHSANTVARIVTCTRVRACSLAPRANQLFG